MMCRSKGLFLLASTVYAFYLGRILFLVSPITVLTVYLALFFSSLRFTLYVSNHSNRYYCYCDGFFLIDFGKLTSLTRSLNAGIFSLYSILLSRPGECYCGEKGELGAIVF